ncbi:F-box/LRR-repeat protein 2 isoform X2 [Moschus berezovskii]|uniref:F-box/LRR-repeat protein 2 isoform X2 n=1 Tax=Moschus berezovskii TaxID=68408 RepID=UPI002443D1A3|nr:F-box/LRR-repeat protein 2 isoform X2 [Moschus berezovskii]
MVFSNNDEGLINKKLPKELLLRIFSFLDIVTLCRCAQISKAWNILALDGSNWQRIDLFNFQTDVEGRVVENISKRCGGFLRKLSLRGCIGVGDSSLKTFAQNCRNIEHLNLNGCTKITDSTCYSLSRFCSKLKHLDLTSCVSITNSSLKGISEGCRHLEYLNLSWCDQITKDGVEALVRGCRGLRALLLRGCTQLEDEALKHIQNYCHELVSLNLQSCSRVTDDGVVQLCRGCPRLQALCLSGCGSLTDASLTALALNCPRLQILEAARCSHLTDAGFTLLARNCHDLEKMDLEECILITDRTLTQLSIHCPKLQALAAGPCVAVDSLFAGREPVPLRAHHGRRHPAPEQQPLWPREAAGAGAGQLPAHHRRGPGAPGALPWPGAPGALRLPAGHPSRHQAHAGAAPSRQGPRLLRTRHPADGRGRGRAAALQVLCPPLTARRPRRPPSGGLCVPFSTITQLC